MIIKVGQIRLLASTQPGSQNVEILYCVSSQVLLPFNNQASGRSLHIPRKKGKDFCVEIITVVKLM